MAETEDECIAREMFDPLDVYEPSREIWVAIREFLNPYIEEYHGFYMNLTCKLVTHNTTPSILETFLPKFFEEFPLVNGVVILLFTFKLRQDDPDCVRRGALLLLDNNRKAYRFVPTGHT